MNQTGRAGAALLAVAWLALMPLRMGAAAPDRTLPPLPGELPAWMKSRKLDHRFYKRGPYNFAVYGIRPLARDLNAVAVGHAMAYEDLVTGKVALLETETFERTGRSRRSGASTRRVFRMPSRRSR